MKSLSLQAINETSSYEVSVVYDDMRGSHDMTPEELYDVIAEEIDHIYAVD